MGKGTFFTGQPIFNQILEFIPRSMVHQVAREQKADRYSSHELREVNQRTMLIRISKNLECPTKIPTLSLAACSL